MVSFWRWRVTTSRSGLCQVLRGSRSRLGQEGTWRGLKGCGCQEDRQLQGPWMTGALEEREVPLSLIVRQTKHKATQTKWLHCLGFTQKPARGGVRSLSWFAWGSCESWREVLGGDNGSHHILSSTGCAFLSAYLSSECTSCVALFFDSTLIYRYLSMYPESI